MKKILLIVPVIFVVVFSIFLVQRQKAIQEWNQKYTRCREGAQGALTQMQLQLEYSGNDTLLQEHLTKRLEEFNTCVDDGGCYTCRPCNMDPDPGFVEVFLDMLGGYMCTLDCRYFCMYPADHY